MARLVDLNSQWAAPSSGASSFTASNYQTTIKFSSQEEAASYTKVKVFPPIIPQSMVNIPAGAQLVFSEPSGGGGSQVQKTATFPAGIYTIDSFTVQYAISMNAASGLASPSYTVSQVAYDALLIFAQPLSSGSPVGPWKILWDDSTPILGTICGFTDNTASASSSFTSTQVYNFSQPQNLFCSISILTPAISPGCPFSYSFRVFSSSNSQMIEAGSDTGLIIKLNQQLTDSNVVFVTLFTDAGQIADLRGCNWSVTLGFM